MLSQLTLSWRKRLFQSSLFRRSRTIRSRLPRAAEPLVELLEDRFLPSVSLNIMEFHERSRIPSGVMPSKLGILPMDNGSTIPLGLLPSDLQIAYGTDQIMFGSIVGDGKGQTIAIVDAYDDPKFLNSNAAGFATSDLANFDIQVGLPDPPSFTKVNQLGQSSPLPGTDPAGAGNANGNWEIEEALDIEYAHGIAPGANIILVEANSSSDSDLFGAVAMAAGLPGVSAVSMSWGETEFSSETSLDSSFVTPHGHQGVTFLASSGDTGGFGVDANGDPTNIPGIDYPAASPNVVAVGGTSLVLNDDSSYNSETAWSGSGGGTSVYEEPVPTYQQGAQTTGFRTTPDVAFDADPNTGVSVFDSYNNLDGSGPWITVGGTSLGAPGWAGLIAITNQGRVLLGESTLDGPTQTLPALYAISPADFNDITSGNNGVFSAGSGYDEVTGLGSPQAVALTADLSVFGAATHIGATSQPPSSVILGDSFGIVVAAENSQGKADLAFNGTLTISLDANHPSAVLGGNLTATAHHGVAAFDGLTLNHLGTGYTLTVTSSTFPSITSNSFDVISDPTPWQGTFYPVPTDASLRNAINNADSNGFAMNTILLSASTYVLSDLSSGGIIIENTSSLPSKTLTITGQGQTSSIIGSSFSWHDRIFEIEGSGGQSLNVTMQHLTIEGGNAQNGGVLGGTEALGGGLLIENANVTLNDVAVQNNKANGAPGAAGAAANAVGGTGGAGGVGNNAKGGGIYLAGGTLSLFSDAISGNAALGGVGGAGGAGGGQGTESAPAVTGGAGGSGGQGGSAAGGGIYAASGTVLLHNDVFGSNQAIGGAGGKGGTGGSGGHGKLSPPRTPKPAGTGGPGGLGGAAYGGAIYLAGGSLTLTGTALQKNTAQGGVGGPGGRGGVGTALLTLTSIFGGGSGTTIPPLPSAVGTRGGSGGPGGAGGAGSGGGIYVSGGSLTLVQSTLAGNQALGGAGGVGGIGGTGGLGSATTFFGIPTVKQGGHGGTGGTGGIGYGGGIQAAGGTIMLYADTLNANIAQGGKGGAGGSGGSGPIAVSAIVTSATSGGSSSNNSGGHGGNGGNGGTGKGGGLYVSGGVLTLTNDTVAGNSAAAGTAGSGGLGGHAGSGGNFRNLPGFAGSSGAAYGGGLFANAGTVSFDNSTLALNTQNGAGSAGGAFVASGATVTAVSTIFGGNGPVNFSGSISATDSLFQTTPTGTLSGSGNLVGINPLLAANGLQNNGGPTQTIALQAGSPAIGKGTNPENLFTDQRGYTPRTGPGGTDIGAYQTGAQADTQAPTATLQASAVTTGNTSYTFTITYADNVAMAVATLSGAVVQVLPPSSGAPIFATFEGMAAVGATDGIGDAKSLVATYQITPPGGAWTIADNGVYTVTLGGGAVTDLAGNPVASGSLGTFSVNLGTAGSTTTALAAMPTSSLFGQSVTFTATVTAQAPGSGIPTGTVTFKDGSTILAANVSVDGSGNASFSTAKLTAGSHTITATFTGTGGWVTSISPTLNQVVSKDGTTTVVTSSVNPSVSGQSVTYTATVTAKSPGSGIPVGKVVFKDNGNTLATVTLDANGQASYTTSFTAGRYTIVATYNGGANFTTSTSPGYVQVVNKDATAVTVTSSLNPSVSGQTVVFTATVTAASPGSGIPTGQVVFKDNGTIVATVTLNAKGQATYTTSFTPGRYRITATYNGSANFMTKTSVGYVQVVHKDGAVVAVASSLNPSTSGQAVIFSVTVSAAAPGSGTPTGTVKFMLGSTLLGSRTLTGGTATFKISTLPVGSDQITVVYVGNSQFATSSKSIVQTVNSPAVVEEASLAPFLYSPLDRKHRDQLFAAWG